MESILPSAVAGVIAAVTATAILGIAKSIRNWWCERSNVRHIRNVLIEGRKRVLEAKDTYHKGMDATIPSDRLRAAQYNNMIKRLIELLYNWAVYLSHGKRKQLFDALDWYRTDGLDAYKSGEEVVFPDLQEGLWPTKEMPIEAAKKKFGKLQSIKWLKLKA